MKKLRNILLLAALVLAAGIAYGTAPLLLQTSSVQNYGNQGFVIVGDSTVLPAFAQLWTLDANTRVWANQTNDVRALQRSIGSKRVAAAWYGETFSLGLALSDGAAHRVSLYVLDWNNAGRAQRIEVADAATGTILNTINLSNFSGGVYATWLISGQVTITFRKTAGPDAVVSAVFIDPAQMPTPTPTPSATPTPTPCPGRILPSGKCQK